MTEDRSQLISFLQAIADCEPCEHVPEFGGVDRASRTELLSRAAHLGWINLNTFMGDGTIPSGKRLMLTDAGHRALRDAMLLVHSEGSGTEDEPVSERRERRALVMKNVYELSGGSTTRVVDRAKIAQRLAWDDGTIQPVVRYLVEKQLLKYESVNGGVSLTARGVDEVEEAMSRRGGDGTENLAGIHVTTGDMGGGIVQVIQGGQGTARAAGPGPSRRGILRWLGESTWTVILGAAGILLAGAVAAIIAMSGGTHHTTSSSAGQTGATGSAGPAPAAQGTGKAVSEYADNRAGSPVFARPDGTGARGVPARIPYGTLVPVVCQVPNHIPALTSVTAFYLIAGGRWKGDYVVADTMSNGGPPGNTNTPNVDPRLKPCR
jgi:hypothetical protein